MDITDVIKNIVNDDFDMGVCEEYIVCEECPSYDSKTNDCIYPQKNNHA